MTECVGGCNFLPLVGFEGEERKKERETGLSVSRSWQLLYLEITLFTQFRSLRRRYSRHARALTYDSRARLRNTRDRSVASRSIRSWIHVVFALRSRDSSFYLLFASLATLLNRTYPPPPRLSPPPSLHLLLPVTSYSRDCFLNLAYVPESATRKSEIVKNTLIL